MTRDGRSSALAAYSSSRSCQSGNMREASPRPRSASWAMRCTLSASAAASACSASDTPVCRWTIPSSVCVFAVAVCEHLVVCCSWPGLV